MKPLSAIAFALPLLLGAIPHAHAQKGAGVNSATIGTSQSGPSRSVRDHRGPSTVRGGGVSVTPTVNPHQRCRSLPRARSTCQMP
jgi:hypothetical protein